MVLVRHFDEDGRYTDASNPHMVTYIDPVTGYITHYEMLPAVFEEPCTFTIRFSQEEPMTSDPQLFITEPETTSVKPFRLGPIPPRPTRRQVWAEIKDRVDVYQHVVRPPYTMVEVLASYNGIAFLGYGFSKQNRYGPTADEWNEEEGYNRALGRAKKDLLDTIMGWIRGE